jgi:hypothetical protein
LFALLSYGTTTIDNPVDGMTKEVNMTKKKNTKQQGLVGKVKSWFKKPSTLWVAVLIMKVLRLAFQIYEYFTD